MTHEYHHDHQKGHSHNHDISGLPERKLWIAFILTASFMLIEFITTIVKPRHSWRGYKMNKNVTVETVA